MKHLAIGELLRILREKYSEIHDVFVLALLFSTALSGLYWASTEIVSGNPHRPPLEITAMTLFLLAFTASFYTARIGESVASGVLGLGIFAFLLWELWLKLSGEGLTEENLLLIASFIFGATGSALYKREELMERMEAAFLIIIGGLIIVVLLLSL